jgi:hypothetical protein
MTTYYFELLEYGKTADVKSISTENLRTCINDFNKELKRRSPIENKTDLKKELWELIDSVIPDASSLIGWGSMDSLCEDLINLIKEDK